MRLILERFLERNGYIFLCTGGDFLIYLADFLAVILRAKVSSEPITDLSLPYLPTRPIFTRYIFTVPTLTHPIFMRPFLYPACLL